MQFRDITTMRLRKVVIIGLFILAPFPAIAQTVSLRVDTVQQAEMKTANSIKTVTRIVVAKASLPAFRQFTSDQVGKKIKATVDGVVLSTAVIREPLTGGTLNISPPISADIPTGSTLVLEVTD